MYHPYKGADLGSQRRNLVKTLLQGVPVGADDQGLLRVELSKGLQKLLVEDSGADALDAVLAAVGAACATRRKEFPAPANGTFLEVYRQEACVYC